MKASSESGLWATVIFMTKNRVYLTRPVDTSGQGSVRCPIREANRRSAMREAVMRFARVMVLVVVSGATALAQIYDLSRIPTISPVPNDFVGNWDWTTPRQSCGTSRDSYGQSLTFEGTDEGRVICQWPDRKSTRLNSSHSQISYAVFCLKKKKKQDKKSKYNDEYTTS